MNREKEILEILHMIMLELPNNIDCYSNYDEKICIDCENKKICLIIKKIVNLKNEIENEKQVKSEN